MMTPEELRRMMAGEIRMENNQLAPQVTMESQVNGMQFEPGFMNQTAEDPRVSAQRRLAQQIKGREAGLKARQAQANQLMQGTNPQGRRVGPSNIYVGPNVGETVQDAVSKLTGGLVQRSVNREQGELDDLRTEQALEKAIKEEERQRVEDDFKQQGLDLQLRGILSDEDIAEARNETSMSIAAEDRTSREGIAAANNEAEAQAATVAEERRAAAAALARTQELQDQAQAQQDAIDRSWKAATYQMPDGEFNTLVFNDAGEARYGTSQGEIVPPEVVRDAVAYKAGQAGSVPDRQSAAALKATRDIMLQGVQNNAQLTNTTNSLTRLADTPDLGEFSGRLNVKRPLAYWGLKDTDKFEITERRFAQNMLNFFGDYAEIFRPMSDADVARIAAAFPAGVNDPAVLFDYMATDGLDALRTIYQEERQAAIAAGRDDLVAAQDAHWQKIRDDMVGTALRGFKNRGTDIETVSNSTGYSIEELQGLGFQ